MNIVDGGITAPRGFMATGSHIGIKRVKKDISIVTTDTPAVCAGCFTQSVVRAAHIIWDENIVKSNKKVRGIITVSGNANACTGEQGIRDNEKMAEVFAKEIGADKYEIITAATGIIGLEMPMDTIIKGIKNTVPHISKSRDDAKKAASGIITTDTFIKEIAVEINIAGKVVRIGGMAKGSGMIHPNMATVLSFITTDINITQELLQKALDYSIKETYNMISVDGATSTNDMAVVIANGKAENTIIDEENEFFELFKETLYQIHLKFAKDIVHDGEGASKFMEAAVINAKSEEDAKILAKSIVTNDLVKTALYGEDANWGRVAAAMGGSGAYFNPNKLNIYFASEKGCILMMQNGRPIQFDENYASEVLGERDIKIVAELCDGEYTAKAWGCDLGHEYVRINGEYRSRT